MSRYLVMTKFVPGQGPAEGSPEHAQEMRAWDRFNSKLAASGQLVDSYGLDLSTHTIPPERSGNDNSQLVFAAYAIESDSLAEVEAWANQMPVIEYGSVEIRRILFQETP